MVNDNFPLYLESLEWMAALEVNGICYEHCGALFGSGCRICIEEFVGTDQRKNRFLSPGCFVRGGQKDVARSEVEKILNDGGFDLITEEILMQVYVSMIESVS